MDDTFVNKQSRSWNCEQNSDRRSKSCSQFLTHCKKKILKVRVFCVLTSNFTCRYRISSPTTWWYSHPWLQPFCMRSPLWNIALRERYILFFTRESRTSLLWKKNFLVKFVIKIWKFVHDTGTAPSFRHKKNMVFENCFEGLKIC